MGTIAADPARADDLVPAEVLVGRRLRDLRSRQGLSLRALAHRSGLNINTLSLIENGKTSPSVSTLQQLAFALKVPIAAFFESDPIDKQVVFTSAAERPGTVFGSTRMQNLGKDLAGRAVQPFMVTLEPGKGSGEQTIVHTGHEFVYCLRGSLHYQVEDVNYDLKNGDCLLFEAHLPHCWENKGNDIAQVLLVLCPSDEREVPGGRHFSPRIFKKEISMKIAAITDDGKTISQHFGRAPYYLVLTIEEGKIVHREKRDKMGHTHFNKQHASEGSQGAGHGMDSESHHKHISMAEVISDCKVLLCGGMGMGAYESMRQLNIQPIVTDLSDIDEAAQAFIDGKLIDHTELLH
ncbi:MAG: cupin domain-containing protein [Anaerolineaceae bacterium]|nr:cupin domain-containing protein [Anaerolineaceae bacterium]MBN2677578.1 cupin domain-containing protein [Anaerolineaceae bacterium]